MINGLVNVYKEKGYTSFDVVAICRGIFGQRKIGHTGTLDPDAEGVLPICLGNATKLCDMLNDKSKEYVATFMLGRRTDTLDISGEVLEEREVHAAKEDIVASIASFKGGYNQIPPMYSAKWVDGRRLYDLARQGKEIEREPVWVRIDDIECVSVDLPYVTIRVSCGKGTYIRSLCEDIAGKVGELAVMTSLKRTRVMNFGEEQAYTLDKLKEYKETGELEKTVTPTDAYLMDYRRITVLKDYRKVIDNGNRLYKRMITKDFSFAEDEIVRVYRDDEVFMGLYSFAKEYGTLSPYKMFLEPVEEQK